MAIRRILTYPDPALHRTAEPVTTFDVALANLVSDMVETMRQAPGIGLAAPQVGEPIRLVVVEAGDETELPPTLYVVCNPVIVEKTGFAKIEEGCLSVPGFYVEVDRAKEITLEGQSLDGSPFSLKADGLLSICFQHELDHLDGKLLTNYVSPLKRQMYKDELKKRRTKDGTAEDRRPAL